MSGVKRVAPSDADPHSPLTTVTKGTQDSVPTNVAPEPKRPRTDAAAGPSASPRGAPHEEETTTRRTRRAPARFAMEVDGDNEKLQVALERSKRLADHCGTMSSFTVPSAPVFRPTAEEFSDPCSYIERIRPLGELYGMCTITLRQDGNCPQRSRLVKRARSNTRQGSRACIRCKKEFRFRTAAFTRTQSIKPWRMNSKLRSESALLPLITSAWSHYPVAGFLIW
jgi:hypothetical protein